MKELLLIFHLIVANCISLNAQLSNELASSPSEIKPKKVQKNLNNLYFLVMESFPLEQKGKIYFSENFMESTLISFSDEQFNVEMRYRIADDEMQIMHQEKIKAIVPQKVKQLIFKNKEKEQIFVPMEYSDKKSVHLGYFELIADGEMKLLKQFQKDGKEKIKTKLFFQSEENPAESFKVKKSSVLKLMKKHKSEVSKFIVKNKLNVKKENDLKKVVDFYNSLL